MKKRFSKILVLVFLALFLFSCGQTKDEKPNTDPVNAATEEAKNYNLPEGTYHYVTFKEEDVEVLKGIVREGTMELYVNGVLTDIPSITDKEGYKEKWSSTALNNVASDIVINAVYTIEEYTYKFIIHDQVVESVKFKYGTELTEDDLPIINEKYGFENVSWDIELPHVVKGSLKVYADFEYIEFSEIENEEFNTYLDDLFYEELGTDPMSITFNLYHPENFYKEGVFDFNECIFEGYTFSQEAEKEYYDAVREVVAELEKFDNTTLTKDQYLSKIVLLENYNTALKYEDFYYYGTYLGSYLGYQANLPLQLAEYRFDNKKSIEDYLSYVRYTQDTFEGIVQMENEKAALGMPLTDTIINRVIDQCDEYVNVDGTNPNFLVTVVNNKIDKCEFLTAEEKEYYKELNTETVNECFLEAYTYLRNELEKMLGRENDVVLENGEKYIGALAQMERGAEYYEIMLQDNLGTSMTADEVYKYLNTVLSKNMSTYRRNADYLAEMEKKNLMVENGLELDDLIPFFMEAIKEDFPELDVDLQYSITALDPALEEHSSPAMYFISPIDDNLTESIYINEGNKDLSLPSTYMYTTIAHEGYPGHLYQNVYRKNLDHIPDVIKLGGNTSYAEGWATHIEYYVLNYLVDDPKYAEAKFAYDSLTYLILGMADIGLNYYGWNFKQVKDFLQKYFNVSDSDVEDIMYDLTEVPTNYLMYFFSCCQIRDFMDEFKELMGEEYSDKLFHTVILDAGAVSFDVLKYRLYDYYEANKAE